MAIGTTAAIIGAAVIGAGTAVATSKAGRKTAREQTGAIGKGTAASVAEQRRQFDISQQLTQPRREAENAALAQLQNILGIGTSEIDLSGIEIPGQQFAIDEASRAIERSAAARGGLASGNTLAALSDRALGITNQNFLSNFLNPLQNLALGGAGAQAGQNALNLGVNVGGELSRAGVNRANILGQQTSAAPGVASALQGGLANFLLMQQLQQGGATAGGGAAGAAAASQAGQNILFGGGGG